MLKRTGKGKDSNLGPGLTTAPPEMRPRPTSIIPQKREIAKGCFSKPPSSPWGEAWVMQIDSIAFARSRGSVFLDLSMARELARVLKASIAELECL